MERRDFIHLAGAAVIAPAAVGSSASQPEGQIKKAIKLHMFEEELTTREKFHLIKELGFDGVEVRSPNERPREEFIRAEEETGLTIHGVVAGWKPFGSADSKVRDQSRAELERAIEDANAYGASTVLVVPATVSEEVSYQDAYWRSQNELRKVLSLAKEYDVCLAVENVWNKFMWSPLEFAKYLDEFYSPWIGAYLDLGNTLTYGWPSQWIRILDHRIVKLDIKDRSRAQYDDRGQAVRTKLGAGDANWAAIREALAEIGYEGWGTAEVEGGDHNRVQEISERMDQILLA